MLIIYLMARINYTIQFLQSTLLELFLTHILMQNYHCYRTNIIFLFIMKAHIVFQMSLIVLTKLKSESRSIDYTVV